MPIQLIDISSSHSTLLFFLAWQKNVFPPLLPIVPTPCGTFYKGPTRPLLSIGKSIIKDSVNMNVAIGCIFCSKTNRVEALFLKLVLRITITLKFQRDRSSQTILGICTFNFLAVLSWMCYWIWSFYQRENQVDQSNSCKKWTTLKKRIGKLPNVQTQVGEKREKRREG